MLLLFFNFISTFNNKILQQRPLHKFCFVELCQGVCITYIQFDLVFTHFFMNICSRSVPIILNIFG